MQNILPRRRRVVNTTAWQTIVCRLPALADLLAASLLARRIHARGIARHVGQLAAELPDDEAQDLADAALACLHAEREARRGRAPAPIPRRRSA